MGPVGSFSAFQAQVGRKVSGQKDVRGPRQGTKGRRDESRERGVSLVKGEGMSPKTPWRQRLALLRGLAQDLGALHSEATPRCHPCTVSWFL